MTELLLSDITLMGPGYCVIGLVPTDPNRYTSLRPLPPRGFAWRDPFQHNRGEYVQAELLDDPGAAPHIEDRQSRGLASIGRSVPEDHLLECLKHAEMSVQVEGLFECEVRPSPQGGPAVWVAPDEAQRSICGCHFENVRFRLYPETQGFTLRAQLSLPSEETLQRLPCVDRDWNHFVRKLLNDMTIQDAEEFLNGPVRRHILASPCLLARIGLPRPKNEKCWLMLDSLFPQPKTDWQNL